MLRVALVPVTRDARTLWDTWVDMGRDHAEGVEPGAAGPCAYAEKRTTCFRKAMNQRARLSRARRSLAATRRSSSGSSSSRIDVA